MNRKKPTEEVIEVETIQKKKGSNKALYIIILFLVIMLFIVSFAFIRTFNKESSDSNNKNNSSSETVLKHTDAATVKSDGVYIQMYRK